MLNPAMRAFPYSASGVDPFADDVLVHLVGNGENGQAGMANMAGLSSFTAFGASISTEQAKYGSTSVKFTTNQYVAAIPRITELAVGAGDFTVESWVYATTSNSNRGIYEEGGLSTLKRLYIGSTNRLIWGTTITSDTDFPANEWVHVAVCRASGTTRMFQNGVLVGSADESTISYGIPGVNRPLIGLMDGGGNPFNGYIQDLRVTAAARYTAAFTPPTEAFPLVITGTDPHWSNVTLLLMNQNETNGSQVFTDLSNSGHTIQPYNNGSPAWQTTHVVAGTAAVQIPNQNPLNVPSEVSDDLTFGTGDFTVELMARLTNVTTQQYLFDFQTSGTTTALALDINTSGQLRAYVANSVVATASTAMTANRWYHVRLARDSGTLKIFLDKAQVASVANTSDLVGLGASGLMIGGKWSGQLVIINGQLDCFRVTKGVFRDPANEPAAPLRRYQTG